MSRVLVVYWHPHGQAMRPAVEQHLRSLERYAARGPVEYLNSYISSRRPVFRGARYDAVVLHTTFLTQRWGDTFGLFKQRFDWLADFGRRKIAIPQDEYDHPYVLDEWLHELGVEDVFTNFAEPERAILYPILAHRARFHECLTGYIDPDTARGIANVARSLGDRPLDVVYRASQLPYWFGRHGQLKHRIGEVVAAAAARRGLATDISMSYDDVIYGDAWFSFLASGRSVIGAESGSSVLDRRGEIQAAIRGWLAESPELRFEEVDRRLPPGWDDYRLTAVSPRHFEAVITRTPQLLVEGSYSGVLERDVHYVPIRSDLSDVDDALARTTDLDAMERMVATAYDDIYASGLYTYRAFARQLADAVYAGPERSPMIVFAGEELAPAADTAKTLLLGGASLSGAAAGCGIRLLRLVLRTGRRLLPARARFRSSSHSVGVGPALPPEPVTPLLGARTTLMLELVRSMLGLLMRNPALARLVVPAVLRGTPARPVARDLLRLALLDRGRRHHANGGGAWTCVAERRGDALVLTSQPSAHASASVQSNGSFRELVWDHSAVGTTVPFSADRPELGGLALGADGVYEFSALSSLARRSPLLAAAAVYPYGRGA